MALISFAIPIFMAMLIQALYGTAFIVLFNGLSGVFRDMGDSTLPLMLVAMPV